MSFGLCSSVVIPTQEGSPRRGEADRCLFSVNLNQLLCHFRSILPEDNTIILKICSHLPTTEVILGISGSCPAKRSFRYVGSVSSSGHDCWKSVNRQERNLPNCGKYARSTGWVCLLWKSRAEYGIQRVQSMGYEVSVAVVLDTFSVVQVLIQSVLLFSVVS